ncbi:phosphoribosyltransferase [Gordonia hankookensis]|uniref:Phosphoribosyltransferase n=1 Tax=Gordonia hankookensis TaxID=589403 RepID=A0ABR7WI92_9ACTN|nr:phosphoribosyltransferase family protein [Gordonia hankookensis]MBD1322436.1 phosphoribosyltransferase [Gordonia hankookensis]
MSRRAEVFADRQAAGRALVERLHSAPIPTAPIPSGSNEGQPHDRIVVLGLARGGVPVARVVADALGASLDALVVRKLGAPGQPEFAMGALAAGQVIVNDDVPRRLGVSPEQFQEVVDREEAIRIDREHRYREGAEPVVVEGKTVILVDDGMATGSTMAVALRAVGASGAGAVVIAVPTAPDDAIRRFTADPAVDAVVCVSSPEPFHAVGLSYRDFHQVGDDEVTRCLRLR